jgi:hypothetical protein
MQNITPTIKQHQHIYLAIDPGLKNTCVTLSSLGLDYNGEIEGCIWWTSTANLEGQVNPDKERAKIFFEKILEYVSVYLAPSDVMVLVEFQPPINLQRNPVLIRWNSWIEAYSISFFETRGFKVEYIFPATMKKHFGIASTSHYKNKKQAIKAAEKYMIEEKRQEIGTLSDHAADCFLMAVYHMDLKREGLR